MEALDYLWLVLMHPKVLAVLDGALKGWALAFAFDLGNFRGWQKWDDFATYDWKVASFRWAKGAVLGALAGLGWNLVS